MTVVTDPGGDWPDRIRSAWQRSVEAIIETGRLIAEAKAALPHGKFLRMIDGYLPFTASTAQRLMKIAADGRLSHAARVQHLPASWGALYELTKLDDATLDGLFEAGTIRPEMSRDDIAPARQNLRAAVGTASATDAERGDNLYETPPEAMHALLALEAFDQPTVIWEPACGRGAILRPLQAAGRDVVFTDLVDYETANADGELQEVGDFLETRWSDDEQGIRGPWRGALWTGDRPSIVTNPPYGEALNAFVAHALREHRPPKMALLLNLNFLCGFNDADRNFAMDDCPPARIHVFTRRLPMMHRDGWDGPIASSRMNTAWFVWERDDAGAYAGPAVINRVDWKDHLPLPGDENGMVRVSESHVVHRDFLTDEERATQETRSAERGRDTSDPSEGD